MFPLAYSVVELAKATNTGRATVFEEIRKGNLRARKLGARTVIDAAAAAEWIKSLPMREPGKIGDRKPRKTRAVTAA